MIMHGASIMIFRGIVKFQISHSDLTFNHQFHQNITITIHFIKKIIRTVLETFTIIKSGFLCGQCLIHYALLRINIAFTVLQLLRTQVVIFNYYRIFIIKKIIQNQDSKSIILLIHVLMIMHDAYLFFQFLFHFSQVLIRILILTIYFIEIVTFTITFIQNVNIVKTNFLRCQCLLKGYCIIRLLGQL